MAELIIRGVPVKYTGLYSDDHLIDLQQFGESLQGLAKVSNAAVDFYLHGRISARNQYQVRMFAAPPEPGCVLINIVGLMAAGGLPFYAPLLCSMAEDYLIPLIKAMILNRLKRPDLMEKQLELIEKLTDQNHEFAKIVHGGQMEDKRFLQQQIIELSDRSASPLKQLVKPIGRTCSVLQIGETRKEPPLIITEAEAQALSSRQDLKVEDARQFRGIFKAVDTITGISKFHVNGDEKPISGKITDPALISAQNVYTHSLDTATEVTITAKPVIKDGEIERLYISDGKALG